MSFPQTRMTLIERLAAAPTDSDWKRFLDEYWPPVCRFAERLAPTSDAEDVAAAVFETLVTGNLLGRWRSNRTAKLRTLLCAVAKNSARNLRRRRDGQAVALDEIDWEPQAGAAEDDAFYTLWAENFVRDAAAEVFDEYHAAGKSDYVRTLFGRVVQKLSIKETADAIGAKPTDVENYFRHIRKALSARLLSRLREHVAVYCTADELETESADEWRRLAEFFARRGGLDDAIGSVLSGDFSSERSRPPTNVEEIFRKLGN
jgi:DNA-directed RNA polymerase specialized sigma24 family protein